MAFDGIRHKDKCVLITGAAQGIGRAAALRLAGEGANLVALDLSAENLESLKAEAESFGVGCETVTGSVADLAILDQTFELARVRFGRFDGLVNNAGIGGYMKRFDEVEVEEFHTIVDINLRSVWYGMKLAYGAMAGRGGAIVNVSSMAGIRPNRHHSPYGMTKAAVISLTQHASMDYAPANIRVNALCPGPVETPIFDQMRNYLDEEGVQRARSLVQSRTVMNRFGTPEEQAAAISFLLSDDASFVTGIAMPVDGGWSVSDGRRM